MRQQRGWFSRSFPLQTVTCICNLIINSGKPEKFVVYHNEILLFVERIFIARKSLKGIMQFSNTYVIRQKFYLFGINSLERYLRLFQFIRLPIRRSFHSTSRTSARLLFNQRIIMRRRRRLAPQPEISSINSPSAARQLIGRGYAPNNQALT